jgi:hypothetical protein
MKDVVNSRVSERETSPDDFPLRPETNLLEPWGESIWFYKLQTSTILMVICRLEGGGGAWLWNPVKYSSVLEKEILAHCGAIRHIVVATYDSHCDYVSWCEACPKARLHILPGLDVNHELSVDYILTESAHRDYSLDLDQTMLRGSSRDHAVFFHRPSHTVLFGDLLVASWQHSLLGKYVTHQRVATPYRCRLDYWWHGQQDLSRRAIDKALAIWNPKHLILRQGLFRETAVELITQGLSWLPDCTEAVVEEERVGEGMLNSVQFTTGCGMTQK